MFSCAYCYVVIGSTNAGGRCGRCRSRHYCSKVCQKADWKAAAHKRWCGQSGELNVDFEVKDSPDKEGVGVFALRDFKRGEKVMVERPVMSSPLQTIPEASKSAIKALLPVDGTLVQKFRRNAIACSDDDDDECGLFINMSRVNHDCIGNTEHAYLANQGIKILVCCRDISSGEEITFTYCPSYCREDVAHRRRGLQETYGFTCQCLACSDKSVEQKLLRAAEMDPALMQLGAMGEVAKALRKGEALIKLYDELQYSPKVYCRTYYDMFQIAITRRQTCGKGREFAKKAAVAAALFYGDEHELVCKYQQLAENPSAHRNYHILG